MQKEEIYSIVAESIRELAPKCLSDVITKRFDYVFEKNMSQAFAELYETAVQLKTALNKLPGIKDGEIVLDTSCIATLQNQMKHCMQYYEAFYRKIPDVISSFTKDIKDMKEAAMFLKEINSSEGVIKKMQAIEQHNLELKYIGNRLKNIESFIEEISKDGIKRNISIEVSSENLEIKNKNETPLPPKEPPKREYEHVLKILDTQSYNVVISRLGIPNGTSMPNSKVASTFGISQARCSQIFRRAIRRIVLDKTIKWRELPDCILKRELQSDFERCRRFI